MNVSIPQTWEQFVAGQMSAGEFGNASEVVREALRLLRDQQEERARMEMAAAFADTAPANAAHDCRLRRDFLNQPCSTRLLPRQIPQELPRLLCCGLHAFQRAAGEALDNQRPVGKPAFL